MNITFYSNFLNHHQLPICEELSAKKNIKFTFVATEQIPQERLDLGYEDMNKKYPFVLTTYDSEKNYEKAIKLGLESDIVIIGSAPDDFIKQRLKYIEKITFRYSERIFKKSTLKNLLSPFKDFRIFKKHYKNHKYYLLCASAYSRSDFNKIGHFKNKCFKWGYFPKVNKYDIDKLINNKSKKKITILWVARFLDWKHPEYAIDLAKYLNSKNYSNYQIKMIGIGPEFEKCKKLINDNNLKENVILCGSMPNEKVIDEMKKANIYIFTSDRGEGWGAVLNESMNNGCAIVANKNIGSVPYIIEDGKNGYSYSTKKEFYKSVEILINDKEKREKIGKNAYYTMINKWNAENAVKNFLDLSNKILNNEDISNVNYDNGPCSKDDKQHV